MKKLFIITLIVCSIFIQQKSFADTTVPVSSIVKSIPSSIDFSKSYKTTSENLLYLLLQEANNLTSFLCILPKRIEPVNFARF